MYHTIPHFTTTHQTSVLLFQINPRIILQKPHIRHSQIPRLRTQLEQQQSLNVSLHVSKRIPESAAPSRTTRLVRLPNHLPGPRVPQSDIAGETKSTTGHRATDENSCRGNPRQLRGNHILRLVPRLPSKLIHSPQIRLIHFEDAILSVRAIE
ncbi:hypothetical protein V8G54_016213 [Vigna mungo]|uniref:Uncharacterized protein n=1 Tax=Vigna mungo TaxID=3915 RepID=A0AAQ3NMH2_VIGMU